jgi:protein O-GlcNAc transferase
MTSTSADQLLAIAKQHFRAGRFAETESLCQQLILKNPGDSEAIHLLGVLAHSTGRQEEAERLIRRAIAASPKSAHFYNNLGAVLTTLGRSDDAVEAYTRAVALQPNMAEAYNNMGNVLEASGRLDEAIAACRKALQIQPNFVSAFNNLGKALLNNGQVNEAIECNRQGLKLAPTDAALHSNLIVAMQYSPDFVGAAREEMGRWDTQHARPLRSNLAPHPNHRDPNRRLRIGYVSADFRDHSSAFFLWPLLSNHDRQEYEITVYAEVMNPDQTTERFKSVSDHWRSSVGHSDEQIAAQVRADQIDILVDLKLHTADNRLMVFARKPAPVQISWLGYPGSSGLATIDYRLTDSHLEPIDSKNRYPDEPLRLPDCFWCYDPLNQSPAVGPLPAIASGHLTFGCLNSFFKLNDTTIDLWSEVLRAIPNSRMILLAPMGSARARITETFAGRGIQPDRVEYASRQSRQGYLQTYHRIDVCLDTIPYNGHTTSLDAFWMGIPVLTLVSDKPVGRAGWTELSNLGLTEFAATNRADFVHIATALAGDIPRLAELRSTLRQRLQQSPLMDGVRFARAVEAAYRSVWKKWCAG